MIVIMLLTSNLALFPVNRAHFFVMRPRRTKQTFLVLLDHLNYPIKVAKLYPENNKSNFA